jgi:hypothetical protein
MKLQLLTASLLLGSAAMALLTDVFHGAKGVSSSPEPVDANSLEQMDESLNSDLSERGQRYVRPQVF